MYLPYLHLHVHVHVHDSTYLLSVYLHLHVLECTTIITNPRRACAARVTVVVLFVCLSTTILALQATRRLMSDTNSFSAKRV